mmetsp:Transcript_5064/g.15177  ORF Transcript_5064/g.15177 Transcript_5064/m.15177 type:complete len:218 (-) Transcript_5064:577-1230(-)
MECCALLTSKLSTSSTLQRTHACAPLPQVLDDLYCPCKRLQDEDSSTPSVLVAPYRGKASTGARNNCGRVHLLEMSVARITHTDLPLQQACGLEETGICTSRRVQSVHRCKNVGHGPVPLCLNLLKDSGPSFPAESGSEGELQCMACTLDFCLACSCTAFQMFVEVFQGMDIGAVLPRRQVVQRHTTNFRTSASNYRKQRFLKEPTFSLKELGNRKA